MKQTEYRICIFYGSKASRRAVYNILVDAFRKVKCSRRMLTRDGRQLVCDKHYRIVGFAANEGMMRGRKINRNEAAITCMLERDGESYVEHVVNICHKETVAFCNSYDQLSIEIEKQLKEWIKSRMKFYTWLSKHADREKYSDLRALFIKHEFLQRASSYKSLVSGIENKSNYDGEFMQKQKELLLSFCDSYAEYEKYRINSSWEEV